MEKDFREGSDKGEAGSGSWTIEVWLRASGLGAFVGGGIGTRQDCAAFKVLPYGPRKEQCCMNINGQLLKCKRKLFTTLRITWCWETNVTVEGHEALTCALPSPQQWRFRSRAWPLDWPGLKLWWKCQFYFKMSHESHRFELYFLGLTDSLSPQLPGIVT